MSYIILTLIIILFFTDTAKLSLMPVRIFLSWCLCWTISSYFLTVWITDLSTMEAMEYINLKNILIFRFIEIIIFQTFIYYKGKGRAILELYPGLMLAFPIGMLSFWLGRIITGLDFAIVGLITATLTAMALTVFFMLFRWMNCDKSWLYILSVINFFFCIIVYGIL